MGTPDRKRNQVRGEKRAKHLRHALVQGAPVLSFMHVPPKDLEGAILWGMIKHLSRFVRVPGARRVFYIDVVSAEREVAQTYEGRLVLTTPFSGNFNMNGDLMGRAYYLAAMCPQYDSVHLFRLKVVGADLFICAKYFRLYFERHRLVSVINFHMAPMVFALGDPDLAGALRVGLAELMGVVVSR